jgi:hypothetical protein
MQGHKERGRPAKGWQFTRKYYINSKGWQSNSKDSNYIKDAAKQLTRKRMAKS